MNMHSNTVPLLGEDDLRFLGEVGLMAVGADNGKAAQAIFEGLLVLRPNRSLPYIGLSMAKQCLGETAEALRILSDEGLRANPGSDEILVFLGLALRNANRSNDAQRILSELMASPVIGTDVEVAGDTAERRFARTLLAELASARQTPMQEHFRSLHRLTGL